MSVSQPINCVPNLCFVISIIVAWIISVNVIKSCFAVNYPLKLIYPCGLYSSLEMGGDSPFSFLPVSVGFYTIVDWFNASV